MIQRALAPWLGGELAAALLTRYLRPENVTLCGATRFNELATRIRPVKDEHENLELPILSGTSTLSKRRRASASRREDGQDHPGAVVCGRR